MGACEQKHIVVQVHDRKIQVQIQPILKQMSARLKACQKYGIDGQDDQNSQDGKKDEQTCCGKSVFFSSCFVFIHSHISVPPS